MKKGIFLVCAILACSCLAFADDQQQDQKTVKKGTKSCTTVYGSALGNGGSTTTCVTNYTDGSKKTVVESCTTTGASASVGVAKAGVEHPVCDVTEIYEPAKKSNNNSGNSSTKNNSNTKNNSK